MVRLYILFRRCLLGNSLAAVSVFPAAVTSSKTPHGTKISANSCASNCACLLLKRTIKGEELRLHD